MVRRGRRDRRDLDIHGEQRYLGELQAQIMEITWARGQVTVRAVLDALEPGHEPAYTTVMTVMARLAEEGMLARELVGKTYIYSPACTREEFRARIAGTIAHDLVADFGDLAIAQFVDAIERAGPASVERLRAFLEQREHGEHGI